MTSRSRPLGRSSCRPTEWRFSSLRTSSRSPPPRDRDVAHTRCPAARVVVARIEVIEHGISQGRSALAPIRYASMKWSLQQLKATVGPRRVVKGCDGYCVARAGVRSAFRQEGLLRAKEILRWRKCSQFVARLPNEAGRSSYTSSSSSSPERTRSCGDGSRFPSATPSGTCMSPSRTPGGGSTITSRVPLAGCDGEASRLHRHSDGRGSGGPAGHHRPGRSGCRGSSSAEPGTRPRRCTPTTSATTGSTSSSTRASSPPTSRSRTRDALRGHDGVHPKTAVVSTATRSSCRPSRTGTILSTTRHLSGLEASTTLTPSTRTRLCSTIRAGGGRRPSSGAQALIKGNGQFL
jgi:hypothetical protein